MNESRLKEKVLKYIKVNFPDAFVYKIADRWMSGLPDIFILYKGKCCFIELKTVTGRLSRIQEYIHQKIREANGKVEVCRSVEEFVNFIKSFYNKEE